MEERTTTQTRNNKCVLTSVSCVMAVTRLAWRPREHTRNPHVEDDRVQKEGALQPRLVPLRVHEGGVHGPAQKVLVEQDAVDVLEQDAVGIDTKNGCSDHNIVRLTSAVLIIVLHTSSVHHQCLSPFVHKKAKINSDREIIMAIFLNSGVFCRILVVLGRNWESKKKRLVFIFTKR